MSDLNTTTAIDANSIEPLDRQLQRNGLFTHTALGLQAERINEVESFLYGLIDVLIKKGITIPDELTKAAEDVRHEMYAKAEHAHAGVGIRIDDTEKEQEFVPVNCAERMHVCHGICCKLQFALSVPEIESGNIKWDLGKPYFIRHEASGFCTHSHPEKRCCTIYENRPRICKSYSCAGDKRIWKDFDNMVLNDEWIDEFLKDDKPSLVTALMHTPV